MVNNGKIKEVTEDMEGSIMILSNLIVKKLYGSYDYDVNFNEDVTLLYGTNGCGKTTILNFITAIITGTLYNLFSYKFENISLTYYDETNKKNKYNITISKKNEDVLEVDFNEQPTIITKLQLSEEPRRRASSIEVLYFEEYPVLNDIRREFNYVYLALNRAISLSDKDNYFPRRRYFLVEEEEIIEPEKVDSEIRYIENLIAKRYMTATSQTNTINNEFRNAILKSALDVNVQTDLGKFMSDFNIKNFKKNEIIKIRDSYVKILSDLNLVSEDEKKQYNIFFQNYSTKIKSTGSPIKLEEMFNLFIEYNEMKKIQNIVDIAADTEKQKAIIMKPIELFLTIVNEFISSSDSNKRIGININGRVYFATGENEQNLSVQFLSSGERQLLIFFANLIFGVKDTSSGIFVVDEPELSLHLSWQKVFVKKALEINNNVQFIFATHAPEIIGKYRDKAENLRRIDSL